MSNTPSSATVQGLDILVVDDEELIRTTVAESLNVNGHRTRSVPSATAALADLRVNRCDEVIASVRIPRMDGLELAAMITRLCSHIRIVIMTGHKLDLSALDQKHLRLDGFLNKPFSSAELTRIVERTSAPARMGLDATEPITVT